MKARICAASMLFLSSISVLAGAQPSAELSSIQEAYKAAVDNLVSGSGIGIYEVYAARPGKESKLELKAKAKAEISFDHGKFYIRLDYDKDDFFRLDSRIIVYDGTAILVNRISKHIHPSHSEGDLYEGKPTGPVMRLAGFDYNPCELPAKMLRADLLSSKLSTDLMITPDANKDYSGSYSIPPVVRCSFLAPRKAGYHIIAYYESNTNHNDFQHVKRYATWERKNNLWYVKSIDNTWLSIDGSGERIVFQYTAFEPNAKVPSSLFKFNSLSLSPTARVIDRRPNADEPVLRQTQSSSTNMDKLDTLAESVKALSPSSPSPAPRSRVLQYLLLALGFLTCAFGVSLLWRRIRKRNLPANS